MWSEGAVDKKLISELIDVRQWMYNMLLCWFHDALERSSALLQQSEREGVCFVI